MKVTVHRADGFKATSWFVPAEKRRSGGGDLAWLEIGSKDGCVVLFVDAEDLPRIIAAAEELAETLAARDRELATV
jgi:hypothetical protein